MSQAGKFKFGTNKADEPAKLDASYYKPLSLKVSATSNQTL